MQLGLVDKLTDDGRLAEEAIAFARMVNGVRRTGDLHVKIDPDLLDRYATASGIPVTPARIRDCMISLAAVGDGLAGNAFISGVARQPEAQGRMIPWLFTIVGLVEAMYFINLAFGFVFISQVAPK